MLQRALVSEHVGERQQQRLRAAGVRHFRQLAQRSPWDVAHTADLSVRDVEELLAGLSVRLAPQSRSAFDMFLESVNHPAFLRTELPALDQALCGGLKHGGLTEVAGVAGIGKSQFAMTLSVLCAMENPAASVLYFDTEHNFSAKRVFQIADARVRLRSLEANVDAEAAVEAIVRRIRIVKVDTLSKFLVALKEAEEKMHALLVKLLVVDSVARLFLNSTDQTHAQRLHQMLKVARDLKLLADTHEAYVVVTNHAVVREGDAGLYTQPQLGETWSHCVTSRLVMERYPHQRVLSIVKSPVAGFVVQPFVVDEAGVQSAVEEDVDATDDFDAHDELFSDIALAGLQAVEPSCTLRSTQKSEHEDDNENEDENEEADASSQPTTAGGVFDLVSDSNDEDEDEDNDEDSIGSVLSVVSDLLDDE